jgi:hypothetical protein
MINLRKEAISWVFGRESDCLRRRVYEALNTAKESGTIDEWDDYDPEAWAEELQIYASNLESVSVGVLALLIEEWYEERNK